MAVTIGTGEIRGTRHVVRTSTGNVYVVFEDGGSVEVWKGMGASAGPYYFDASDAGPTDPDGVWANDADGFDGNVNSFTNTTTIGTETTNELGGEGTDAPASGITIADVTFQPKSGGTGGLVKGGKVYTDGEAEELLSIPSGVLEPPEIALPRPAGGWTWAKVQALEIKWWMIAGTGIMRVYYSRVRAYASASTPTNFIKMDSPNAPSCMADSPIGVAVDGSDNLHIVYVAGTASAEDLDYVTFSTSTDTFGTPEEAISMEDADNTTYGCAVAVDSNDIPHAVVVGTDAAKGTDYHTIYYDNRIGGSWADRREIEGVSNSKQCNYPDIHINSDNYPVIVYVNTTDSTLDAVEGDANDPSTFATREVNDTVTTDATNKPTGCADSSGDTWVTYVDGDGTIDLAKMAATWTDAPTIVSNGNIGKEPSIVVDSSNNDKYIFYEEDGSDDIVYDKYSTAPAWLGETTLETSVAYNSVSARWAFLHLASLQTYGIDYVFDDGTSILFNTLDIGAADARVKKQTMMII